MISTSSRYRNSATVLLTQQGVTRQTIVASEQDQWTFQYTLHTVGLGQRIDTIAAKYYGNDQLWWSIADANPEQLDWSVLTPGQILRIPHV